MRPSSGEDTPTRLRIGVTSFGEFVGASSRGRFDCVQRQVEMRRHPFVPGGDFYQAFNRALVAGRRSGADERGDAAMHRRATVRGPQAAL